MDVNKYLNTYVYCNRTRNYDPNNYNLIIKHKHDYYIKSFFTRAAELWNTLPSNLKSCNSITLFKTKITNLYFDKLAIDRFHLTSRRPYWCTKTMKWRPYWCTVRELALSYSNISYCFTTPLGPPIT